MRAVLLGAGIPALGASALSCWAGGVVRQAGAFPDRSILVSRRK